MSNLLSFSLFTQLPQELRDLIWEESLPHRVLDLDFFSTVQEDRRSRLSYLRPSGNASRCGPPMISRVCRESRKVALLYRRSLTIWAAPSEGTEERTGSYLQDQFEHVWFSPSRDTLHLNWNDLSPETDHYEGQQKLDLSILASQIASFDSGILIVCGMLPGDLGQLKLLPKPEDMLHETIIFSHATKKAYDVTLVTIDFHLTREQVSDCDLFGYEGEEPLQHVQWNDKPRIAAFAARYQNPTDRDSEELIQMVMQYLLLGHDNDPAGEAVMVQDAVDRWLTEMKLYWMWMDYKHWHRTLTHDAVVSDMELWDRAGENELQRSRKPRWDHPLVKKLAAAVPEFRPKLMFRWKLYNKPNSTTAFQRRRSE